MSSLRLTLAVDSVHLEVPVADFEHLGVTLRCQVVESGREMALTSPQGRLVFDRVGPLALLREVDVGDDADGLFTVHVLGRLLAAYEGELLAAVKTHPPGVYPPRVIVRRGESNHPLFTTVMMPGSTEISPEQLREVERLVSEARGHWKRWLDAKASRAGPESRHSPRPPGSVAD